MSFIIQPASASSFVGVLGVTQGGTGLTSLTAGSVLVGNGTSPITQTATIAASQGGTGLASAGTVGNVLTSTGTIWASSAPAVSGAYVTKTTTYTAVSGDNLLVDTSGGAFTITLPITPAANATVYFQDAKGTFGTNNLTVARNGQTIMGLSEDLVASTDDYGFGLIYNGSDWRIF
jgi:hypothetical protein